MFPPLPVLRETQQQDASTAIRIDRLSVDHGTLGFDDVADKTRIFVLGCPVDSELAEAHRFTLQLQSEIEERLRPGVRCSAIYSHVMERVSATAWAGGFMGWGENQVGFIGHGIGLELDEIPIFSARSSTILKEGMTVAIEPKIFFGERGGVGIENSWVITRDGCRNLTHATRDEIIEV